LGRVRVKGKEEKLLVYSVISDFIRNL